MAMTQSVLHFKVTAFSALIHTIKIVSRYFNGYCTARLYPLSVRQCRSIEFSLRCGVVISKAQPSVFSCHTAAEVKTTTRTMIGGPRYSHKTAYDSVEFAGISFLGITAVLRKRNQG